MACWTNSPKLQHSGFASRIRLALRNTHGETITEVLVAMVIVGLALLMLAVVIASSSSIVKKDREYMEDYYETGNALASPSGSGVKGTLTVKYATGVSTGTPVRLSPENDDGEISIEIFYADEGDTVVSYKKADGS